jgi:hypothetical protein
MGIFADTANINNRSSFADQGKQTSVSVAANIMKFAVSVCSKQSEGIYIWKMELYIYIHIQ